MPGFLAVIEFDFDPLFRIAGMTIRWQTIGVTIGLLIALALAALMAPNVRAQRPFFRRRAPDLTPHFPQAPTVEHARRVRPLRLDDMLLIIAGIVPGAVVVGRAFHGLDFWSFYASQPGQLFDPSVGSLSLLGAVIGGLMTASYVARMIDAPVRRWFDAAAVPMLVALGLGKLAQLLGGSGQGLPFDGSWAVAFSGAGPWVSTSAAMPSHPAQVYEGLWMLAGIPIVLLVAGKRHTPTRVNHWVAWADRTAREGSLFAAALGWFLLGRLAVGYTWRDEAIVGGLNVEQTLALITMMLALLFYGMLHYRGQARQAGSHAT
ncbi:MAG TPA: prolipoprotein diacylglyceryl transferase family protein [Candidatus Limnocylindria bacterium]|nr:prolipoprotein diacylglyceryl transferase family protein [Candidatus Limnocylindria bacterium]